MDIGYILFIIVAILVIAGLFTSLIYFGIVNDRDRKYKTDIVSEKTDIIEDFEKTEFRAKIIDQYCTTYSKGIKIPKTVMRFVVCFECENDEKISFDVTEEMYLDLEVGMQGKLTLSGGSFFSFDAENL